MIGRALRVMILVIAPAVAAGCGITDVGKPLSVEVSADPEAASVGDTIRFTVSGTGSFMNGFIIDYNDGSEPDEHGTAGSIEATTTFTHAYGSADTYRAVATVIDSNGQLSDTVEVVIENDDE